MFMVGWLVGGGKFVSYAGGNMPSAWLPQPRNKPLLSSRSLGRTTTGSNLKTVEACRVSPLGEVPRAGLVGAQSPATVPTLVGVFVENTILVRTG